MATASETPKIALAPRLIHTQLKARARPFSASELQAYLDCPFLWFGSHCLAVNPVSEEYGALDRGTVVHGALERFYRARQRVRGEPVHLEGHTVDALWPALEAELRDLLQQEPRFTNRPAFWQDIEWESLSRMLRRFLAREIARAGERGAHPAWFERHFGSTGYPALELAGGVRVRGALDRIDVVDDAPERAVVVDYKTSVSFTLKDLETGKVLQAPIYALALARLLRLTPIGVEFMGIRQGEGRGVFRTEAVHSHGDNRGMKILAPEAWQALLDGCEARIGEAAQRQSRGDIALQPATPRCPGRCEHYLLCRGERARLESLVRQAAQVE